MKEIGLLIYPETVKFKYKSNLAANEKPNLASVLGLVIH